MTPNLLFYNFWKRNFFSLSLSLLDNWYISLSHSQEPFSFFMTSQIMAGIRLDFKCPEGNSPGFEQLSSSKQLGRA